MTYNIYKSDGTPVIVEDDAIDFAYYNPTGGGSSLAGTTPAQGLGVQLIGRDTIDYGASIAQNIIQMTENFASGTGYQPSDTIALQGQLWFNKLSSTSGNLYVRTSGNTTGGMANWNQIATLNSSGIFNGTSMYANNLTGGTPGAISYQTSPNTSAMLPIGNLGQVLTVVNVGGVNSPVWSSTPILSGINFNNIPNGALSTGGAFTLGSTTITLGSALNIIDGMTNITSNTFTGNLSGTATGNVPITGGTMTGNLILNADPSLPLGAATKEYVDYAVSRGGSYLAGHGISINAATTPSTISNTGVLGINSSGTISASEDSNGIVTLNVTGVVNSAFGLIGGSSGSLPYQTSSSTTAFLPPGNAGTVLTIVNGTPTWVDPTTDGVTSLTAGSNIVLSGNKGNITISSSSIATAIGNNGTQANAMIFNQDGKLTSTPTYIWGSDNNSQSDLYNTSTMIVGSANSIGGWTASKINSAMFGVYNQLTLGINNSMSWTINPTGGAGGYFILKFGKIPASTGGNNGYQGSVTFNTGAFPNICYGVMLNPFGQGAIGGDNGPLSPYNMSESGFDIWSLSDAAYYDGFYMAWGF